jgi:uncharacterized membrane protein YfcA
MHILGLALMQLPLLLLVILLASFTHSLAGFGSALVAMPILAKMLGLQIAAPLVALVVPTIELLLLLRYRKSLNLRMVWRLLSGAIVGIPFGVWSLRQVDERTVLTVLGVVTILYALYALFNLKLPELRHSLWPFGFGLVAGLLNGAYNTSGPPIVLYGDCRRWEPTEFKANLQGFFTVSGLWVIFNHAFNGNLTTFVWQRYFLSWIAIGPGIWLGLKMDQHIHEATFRKIVLALLIFLGIMLIF